MENYLYEEEFLNPLNPISAPKSYSYNNYNDNYGELYLNNNVNNENNQFKYDNQLMQINKTFDNHIMEYQQLVQKYKNIFK